MKKRILSVTLAALMIFTLLSSCGEGGTSTEPGDSKPGNTGGDNTAVIGMSTDLLTLDVGHMYDPYGNMLAYALYDMLFRIEKDQTEAPVPSLATEDWTLDETRTVYTFPLRDDVTFTSGNKLTSADVLFSINRVRNLKSNTLPHVENVANVEAPDEYTVVITLSSPDASFLTKLASNAFCIVDSEVVKENGGTDAADASSADKAQAYLDKNSAGSGPYKLVSWTSGVEVVLERNPDYWGEMGNLDRIIIKEIPDANTQIQMIEKGDIDVAFTLNADNIGQLEGKDGVKIMSGNAMITSFLLMNQDESISGPLSNPDVQQAVRLAIDYKGLLSLAGDGAKLPMAFVPEGFIGAESRDENYRDVDAAKALLEKAGFKDGFEVELTAASYHTEGMQWSTIAQKVKNDLAEIGIEVTIRTIDYASAIDEYRFGNSSFLVIHWSPDYLDINNQLAFLPGDTVGLRANWPAEGNEELTELGNKIIGEADFAVREQYSKDLQNMIFENSPYAFLLQHPKNFAVRTNLTEVYYNDLVKIQLKDLVLN